MIEDLPTEQRNPASEAIDSASTVELLELINAEDRRAAEAVRAAIPRIAEALDRIHARFRLGGRLIYVGAGTSGRLGSLDAAELPPTFGLEPGRAVAVIAGGREALERSIEGAEDDPQAGASALRELAAGPSDSVVGLAASGRTPYVLGALDEARQAGALTVGLTTNPNAEIARHAELTITADVGPEVITGSTRMKSGTAQKLILNMLSTGLMVRQGYVLGNLMVNVQLRNRKLWDRATRIVSAVAEVERDAAQAALERTRDVRTAILCAAFALEADEARALLARHDGVLRPALEEARSAGATPQSE